YGFWCGLIGAGLTAFYSWRVIIMTFHGPSKMDRHVEEHVHESPWVMMGPCVVLAIGALVAGFSLRHEFIGEGWPEFWRNSIVITASNHVLANIEELPGLVVIAPTVVWLIGIATAYPLYMFVTSLPARTGSILRTF